jgi:hypothetical protein
MLNSKILAIFQVFSRHMLSRDEENHQNHIIKKNRVFVTAVQKNGNKGVNKTYGARHKLRTVARVKVKLGQ